MKFVVALFYSLLPLLAIAQPDVHSCSVKTPITNLYADRINRIYVVNNSGLFQYDNECRQINSFTQRIAGGISSVDVNNPLKILAFSRAEQKIYLLNDQLHIQSNIALSDLGIRLATLVCNSRHDGFRVFDQATHKLIRFDYHLNRLQENDLSAALNESFEPVMMAENEKIIAISNRGSGIMVFDRFGNYLKTYSAAAADCFYLTDSEIVFTEGDSLVFISSEKHSKIAKEHISPSHQFAIINQNRWIFYDSTGFSVSEK